jgi:two-component system OmpR family sensor kinase
MWIGNLTEGIKGKYDTDKIKQVILNLFHNAVQHTDPNTGNIKLSLMIADNQVELSIRDNGTGIETENLPYIFDRFYRIDRSRTRQYGGAGLGLSITKTIVNAHGGTIAVNSRVGKGSTCLIHLPLI